MTPLGSRKSWMRTTGTLAIIFCLVTLGCNAKSRLAFNDEKCLQNLTNHPEAALPYCDALVRSGELSEKNHTLALILRGSAYRNMGKFDSAIQDFNAAIKADPRIANAFNNRGIAYDYKHDYDAAIQDYDHAIRLRPDYPDAFNNRGLVYREKGEYERALQDFDQAIRFKPGYAEAIANRASTYVDMGNYDRAIEEFARAIKLEPDYAGDFNDRAAAYLGKKEYQQALQDLNRAVTLSPQDPHFLESRGIAYFCVGTFRAAEDDLSLASRLAPTEPSIAVWLYLAQVRTGKNAKRTLKLNKAKLKPVWPEPAVRLFLGKLSPDAFLALANSPVGRREQKRRCQAYFFLGELALIHHDSSQAKELFRKSAKMLVPSAYEHTGAVAELDRMGNHQVFRH